MYAYARKLQMKERGELHIQTHASFNNIILLLNRHCTICAKRIMYAKQLNEMKEKRRKKKITPQPSENQVQLSVLLFFAFKINRIKFLVQSNLLVN